MCVRVWGEERAGVHANAHSAAATHIQTSQPIQTQLTAAAAAAAGRLRCRSPLWRRRNERILPQTCTASGGQGVGGEHGGVR